MFKAMCNAMQCNANTRHIACLFVCCLDQFTTVHVCMSYNIHGFEMLYIAFEWKFINWNLPHRIQYFRLPPALYTQLNRFYRRICQLVLYSIDPFSQKINHTQWPIHVDCRSHTCLFQSDFLNFRLDLHGLHRIHNIFINTNAEWMD